MQWILRFRVCVIICLAVVLISAAVLFSVLRAVLPHATGYKNEIQLELSQQIGLPVEIDSIDAAIHGFSPRLKLHGVSVYDKKRKVPLFNFSEAFVELDVIASILRREIIVDDFGLIGADISIEKISETEWRVQNIKISSEGSNELPEQLMYMLTNADYLLHDSNIYYQDLTGDNLSLNLLDVNITVENSFNNHDIKFSMNLPKSYGENLVVIANLSGDIDELHGDVYVEINQANIKQWNKKFSITDDFVVDANVDVSTWLTLNENVIQSLFVQFDANGVYVKNAATKKTWKTNFLSSNVRYVADDAHWNLTVSDFYFGDNKNPSWGQSTSLIASDDDIYYYLSAEFLRFNDVLNMAEVLLDADQLAELEELKAYQIQADFYNLNLKVPKNLSQQTLLDELYVDASFVDFSLSDDASGIKFTGLDGLFQYDEKQAVIDMVTQNAEVEMVSLFREPIFADTLQGEIRLNFATSTDWQLSAESLQIKNSHFNLFSRLHISPAESGEIFVDIQSDIYDGKAKYANRYLPVGVMSEGLVGWLDTAIVDGYLPTGKFILHGNLNDFPYGNNNGVFQILLDAQNVTLDFLDDWPPLIDATATIKFQNSSLFVTNAKGKTHDVLLDKAYAEILDLDKPYLTVLTQAKGKNADVQSYIWNSGLDDILGSTMRLFQMDGDSELKLKLEVPIDDDDIVVAVDGRLDFINTTINYPALGYELSDINGTVDFTEDEISADYVKAKMNGETVTVNAFTRQHNSKSEVVLNLEGVIGSDYLLQRYDWIPQKWVTGKSDWIVNIKVPYETTSYLAHITASSNLEGTGFHLSDGTQKATGSAIGLLADIDVLDGNGLHVELKATTVVDASSTLISKNEIVEGDILDLYAIRDKDFNWQFDLESKSISGKGSFAESLAKNTRVKLDLDVIDLYTLFYTETSDKSDRLNPADVPPLTFNAVTVLHDKWEFTNAVLETDWHEHGMLINKLSLDGPKMSFDARGTWLTSWSGTHETVLQGKIKSSNIGKTLKGLGFQKSINHAKYKAKFDAKWPAEPYAWSWENMKGNTSFKMKKGEIVDVDPGTGGRLLGLLNIFKLTNRLVFDFDDVTREGFAFDSIDGEFEFVNGDGSLKKFEVSAPAADINMFGSIGMVKHDYELLMRVKPHTDTITFAGGVLIGGVVIGAGLALIQKIFDLGVIGHNVYSITGSWDDPKVEKIVDRNEDSSSDTTDDEDDDDEF